MSIQKEFWSRVDIIDEDKCWLWTGSIDGNRYVRGKFFIAGKRFWAHRLAYFFTYGKWPIPQCCHTCDNPVCCNPAHLFECTQRDNMRDMISKGRRASTSGELNPNSKLSDIEVSEIRKLYNEGVTQVKLSMMYGVRQGYISKLVRNKYRRVSYE